MENSNLLKQNYGQKISIDDADAMVSELINLRANIDTPIITQSVTQRNDTDLIAKINVLIDSQEKNAFIFSKDLLMRFFDGSEVDKFGNPKSANYLMVVLGAHHKPKTVNDIPFEAGSFTVIALGCEKKIDASGEITFHPLDIKEAASEYPPTRVVTKLSDKESFQNEVIFHVR
jgi:hypothetical protein